MGTGFLAVLVSVMILFPDAPISKWLYFHTVTNPLEVVQGLERKPFIYLFVGLFVFQSYAAVMPLEIATMLAWDASLYFDAMISVWAASKLAKSKAAWLALKDNVLGTICRISPINITSRRKRTKVKRTLHKPTNDNEGHLEWMAAA